jgi:hypothetical protein
MSIAACNAPDGDAARVRRQRRQLLRGCVIPMRRVVRVHPRGAPRALSEAHAQRLRRCAARHARARDDHVAHARGAGSGQHLRGVRLKRVVAFCERRKSESVFV